MKVIYTMKIFVLFTLLFSALLSAQDIIPKPQEINGLKLDSFSIKDSTKITYESDNLSEKAQLLQGYIQKYTSKKLNVEKANRAKVNSIHLSIGKLQSENPEAYYLQSIENSVIITGKEEAGVFNGISTFVQMIPVSTDSKNLTEWNISAVRIYDEPAFPWRGVMLDPARYFITKEYMFRYLDMMAMHKLNVLHWHLIDDCGWRIEIKKYPKLTEVGAWRGSGDKKHGGFYSQEDIKEIVAYAAERNIQVVPEIEIPAHTLSALAAYPVLGCNGKKFKVPERHSISPEIYCVGKETTWQFLQDVMDEVVPLFPSAYIHIGGDEARYNRWKACKHCQKVIKDNKLKDERALQGWATRRIAKYLEPKGKVVLGWEEILACGVEKSTGIMTWHKYSTAVEAAKNGHPVVMSPVRHTYIDTPESKLPGEPPAATWTPPVTLSKAYNWDVIPKGLTKEQAKNILGPNACLWNDRFLHNAKQLADKPGKGTAASEAYMEYLSLPRIAATAEVGWTKKQNQNYEDFLKRMSTQYHRYLLLGYNFRVPTPEFVVRNTGTGKFRIAANEPVFGGEVRFTTDGSEPNSSSKLMETAINGTDKSIIKAATFIPHTKMRSLTATHQKKPSKYAKHGTVIGKWEAGKVAGKTPREETFDATGLIDKNGKYEITFIYTSGEFGLTVDGLKVVRNDTVVSATSNEKGFAGGGGRMSKHQVNIQNYQTGASFKIKAKICGDLGSDSNGVVSIKKIK